MNFVLSVILNILGLGLMHSLVEKPLELKDALILMVVVIILNISGIVCCKDKL